MSEPKAVPTAAAAAAGPGGVDAGADQEPLDRDPTRELGRRLQGRKRPAQPDDDDEDDDNDDEEDDDDDDDDDEVDEDDEEEEGDSRPATSSDAKSTYYLLAPISLHAFCDSSIPEC